MIPWKKILTNLTKLKLVSRATGILGILTSVTASFASFVEHQNFIQLGIDLSIIVLDLDGEIYDAVQAMQEAGGTEFIILGIGIYGKLWLLYFLLKKMTGIQKSIAVSEDTPLVPIILLHLVVFVMVFTPLQILGQVFSIALETGEFTISDLRTPWIGLYSVATNLPMVLQPIVDIVAWIIEILPFVDAENLVENATATNTTLENQTQTFQ